MLGSFFSKFAEKNKEQGADGESDATETDFFIQMLSQPNNNTTGAMYTSGSEDPLQYFLSPDPKSTQKPHVSK